MTTIKVESKNQEINFTNTMNLASIIMLLQMALSLLANPNVASNPTLKLQAQNFASQAVTIASNALKELSIAQPAVSSSNPLVPVSPNLPIVQSPVPPFSQPVSPPAISSSAPIAQSRIELINPSGRKGIGDGYIIGSQTGIYFATSSDPEVAEGNYERANPDYPHQQYYVNIGAVLYNSDGSVNNTADINVVATDASQNKTIHGTGNFWGNPWNKYFYPYTYSFKTPGDHTITFSANGATASVTITAIQN